MAKLTLKKNKPLLAEHGTKPFTSPIASAVVTVIALLWTVPTLGLVVTSFRTKEDILSSGWWTHLAIQHLLSITSAQFCLQVAAHSVQKE
jgi:ABC-type glycerol-3-phosphate transport system permease component